MSLSQRSALLAIWLVAAFLPPLSSSATIVKPFTAAEMSREAAVIDRGVEQARQGVWADDKSRIYTDTTLVVTHVVAGRVQTPHITLRQLGGQVAGASMTVAGTAQLSVGEDVLLFLRTDGARFYLVGMAQGKWHIRQDEAGREVIGQSLGALSLLPRRRPLRPRQPPAAAPVTYAQLLELVRRARAGEP